MKQKLSVVLVSEDTGFLEQLRRMVSDSIDFVDICCFGPGNSFPGDFPEKKTDIIFSDLRKNSSEWSFYRERVAEKYPDSFNVYIVNESDRDDSVVMIRAGVYDVITKSSVNRINTLIHRIVRDMDDKINLRELSVEKKISDQIVDNSRSMISIINRDYVYVKVNAIFCNAQGVKMQGLIGKSLAEVWGHDTFQSVIKPNIDLCFCGKTIRYEANFDTPLLGNRNYEVVFRPITLDNGEISHLLAETFDITDLKLTKQVVTDMEEEFKRLKTNLPIGFLRCDPEGIIIHANKAFLQIMECPDECAIAGKGIAEYYSEKGLFEIHLSQLVSSKIKTFGRVHLITCGGNEITCRISGFIVTNESGNLSFIDFAFEDSTRELMLENRLMQAQKLETIGALAGGVAHDFNNILGTIYGYSEMLLDDITDSPSAIEKVNKIIGAISKARSLTDQILTFSRQVNQEKIPVKVVEVLKESIGFVKSARPGNIEILEDILSTDLCVHADPTQLFRVFLNLITNAFQAMEKEGGTMLIRLSVVEGSLVRHNFNKDIVADEYVLINFEDTGEGMDPLLIDRIFEPYFTTREVGKGTGLGLSVVHGIVAEMEGEILVTSKKNNGSVFSVYLPVMQGYRPHKFREIENKKLLFISGNRYESRILSLALESSGYTIVFASDLNKMVKLISDEANLPDLIIYMDDSEEIRPEDLINIYSGKKIITPLLLISDRNQLHTAEKLVHSGIVKQQLTKPVSLRDIHNAIQTSLI